MVSFEGPRAGLAALILPMLAAACPGASPAGEATGLPGYTRRVPSSLDASRSPGPRHAAAAKPRASSRRARAEAFPRGSRAASTPSAATSAVEAVGGNARQPLTPERLARVLFEATQLHTEPTVQDALTRCRPHQDPLPCLHELRYPGRAERQLVHAIHRASGWGLGLLPPREMDGGWRGHLRLVPRLPTGFKRIHLERIRRAVTDFRQFFRRLARAAADRHVRYRWEDLEVRFFESVGRGTPSAYAHDWTIAYNLRGSLLRHARGVRETLFHEIVHLNDAAHGRWGERALQQLHATIVARCTRQGRLENRCLKPYAPTDTKVRRFGIYYAFHPQSGVGEYVAELATRYYREQRAVFRGQPPTSPFKCQTPQNARAYASIAGEFFAGVDGTRCPAPRP